LPFFGGPGNNYSMHALAEMVSRLQRNPDAFGLLAANGGFLSKYAVGIYAGEPVAFDESISVDEGSSDALSSDRLVSHANGEGRVETYTVAYARSGTPQTGIVVGTLKEGGQRFIARTAPDDLQTSEVMAAQDPLGRSITVASTENANHFVFSRTV